MSDNLKPRQYDILKMLARATSPLEIGFLKERLKKSERTIRYDINEMKEICARKGIEICYKTKQGFYIPAEQKGRCAQLLREENAAAVSEGTATEGERIRDMLFYFMVKKRNTGAEQIAGDFYISRSTLSRLINRFHEFFQGEIQLLPYKTGGYELVGDEYVIRRTAVNYLAECFKGSYLTEDWYLFLPEVLKGCVDLHLLAFISNQLKRLNAKYNVWLSNSAFLNLFSYCLVRNIRLRFHKGNGGEKHIKEYGEYAEELLEALDGEDEISQKELEYMKRILAENEIAVNRRELDENKLIKSLEQILEMLKQKEAKGEDAYHLESLYEDLYEHLKNAICFHISGECREEENYLVIREIKDNYPEFYQTAKDCAKILEKEFSLIFSETETCYIGIYLYKNCKEKNRRKKNVLLVCATGKGLSHLLSIRVENVFPGIHVVGQRSPFQLSNLQREKDIDFIISTIPLQGTIIPVVKISMILSNEDIKRIQEFLDYGRLVDEIPFEEQAKASFSSKVDPFQMEEIDYRKLYSNSIAASATTISKLILTLLECTSRLPGKYTMEQDALLGLIIHMSMAVPRWFQESGEEDAGVLEEYERIAKRHKIVFEIMENFFSLVEKSLKVTINVRERIAFFLYIILKEEMEDEDNDH